MLKSLFRAAPKPMARQGNGQGDVLLTFPRGDAEPVDVVGLKYHEEAVRKLVGNRPRDDIEREKHVKVRLLREYDNPHGANAIAVIHDKAGHIGYIPGRVSEQLAPAIDNALREVAKKTQLRDRAVDIYATAEVIAYWPELDEIEPGDDKNEPESIEITLCFDGSWQAKVSARS